MSKEVGASQFMTCAQRVHEEDFTTLMWDKCEVNVADLKGGSHPEAYDPFGECISDILLVRYYISQQ